MIRKFIVGVCTASVVTIGFSVPALADPTCYTGCGPAPISIVGGGPAPISIVGGGPSISPGGPKSPLPAPTESVPTPGGLPVTGQDVEQIAGLAAVLLVGGAAMVRISRRRTRGRARHVRGGPKALV
ncbi:MAG TPA: hypothetical protein VII76_05995 [Acidimicrobiales bacterium]